MPEKVPGVAKTLLPTGITQRARSNSATVSGSSGIRAHTPAPLKRTWEDVSVRQTIAKADGPKANDSAVASGPSDNKSGANVPADPPVCESHANIGVPALLTH